MTGTSRTISFNEHFQDFASTDPVSSVDGRYYDRLTFVWNRFYLVMIRAKDNPAAETVAEVDHRSAAAESNHIWKGRPEGED